MKKRISFLVLIGIGFLFTTTTVEAAVVNDYDSLNIKQLFVQQKLVLRKNAVLKEKGSGSLKIDDGLIVTGKTLLKKKVDVRNAIYNKKGDVKFRDTVIPRDTGTFNLGSTTNVWDTLYVNNIVGPSMLPSSCDDGQVAQYDEGTWVCADDEVGSDGTTYTAGTGITITDGVITNTVTDTDTNTTYTAGTGITITDGVITNTVTDTDTTYSAGSNITIDGGEISSENWPDLEECTNGEVMRLSHNTWSCGSDSDTTYSAGTGISLAGSTFSADLGTSVDASEIDDVTRTIQVPLGSLTIDNELVSSSTTPTLGTLFGYPYLEWETGEEGAYIASAIIVPDDFSSGMVVSILYDHLDETDETDTLEFNYIGKTLGETSTPGYTSVDEEIVATTDTENLLQETTFDLSGIEAGDIVTFSVGFSTTTNDLDTAWWLRGISFEYEAIQ